MQDQGSEAKPKRATPGIVVRHSRGCDARDGGKCSCTPTYEAWLYDPRAKRKLRRGFPTLTAAKNWRRDNASPVQKGTVRAPAATTVRDAAEAWLAAAKDGAITKRGGRPFKPSTLRGYETSLRTYVLAELGGMKLAAVSRVDVQDFADRLAARGLDANTVRNTVNALRVVYRRAVARGEAAVNPTRELELATSGKRRERAASPEEAAELLAALPHADRALWACAFYAGLRRGELRALLWEHVDLAKGVLRVERAWDEVEGVIDPKYAASRRTVPMIALLRDHLAEHRALTGRTEGLVFGVTASQPFTPTTMRKRALRAWTAENADREKRNVKERLEPIGLHECRHTFVTLAWEAGLSLEEIGDYVGHSSAYMTDRYRHLREGRQAESRRQLDDFYARADTAARVAQVEM